MKRYISIISIIFLLTSGTIIFEISLSRLFSYMLSYHFVLIIIAFSILGLGIGQMWYSKNSDKVGASINNWFVFVPCSLLFSYLTLLVLPRLGIFSNANAGLLFFIILSTIPFIFIGFIYAHLFQNNKKHIALLYGFDLLGAALGALLSVLLLNSLNLGAVIGIAALIMVLAFVIHTLSYRQGFSKIGIAAIALLLLILLIGGEKVLSNVPIADDPSKDMLRLMKSPGVETKILASQWSAFGKTDLVQFTYQDKSESEVLFIDGAAGTSVINIDELLGDTTKLLNELGGFPAFFSMNFLEENEKDTALIIGPGGGIDIAASWIAGFKFIKAVEVNPSFVELMENFNQPTFGGKENIKIFLNEGRNFVKEGNSKYDAILLTIPITKGGRGADFYGLTENYLFTVEALNDYLESLTEEGVIFFTMHGKGEAYKMLANYLELQDSKGIRPDEALKSVYLISNGMNPVMAIRKNIFTPERIEEIHAAAHHHQMDGDIFFFPYIDQINSNESSSQDINDTWYMFDNLLYDISKGKYAYSKIWEASMHNLSPSFDNTPFFFNYTRGIPDALSIPLWLGLAIIAWVLYKIIKGWKVVSINSDDKNIMQNGFGYLTFMVLLLGFSYFFIQAYLFQILNLRLSNPTQSFSLLLFAFLLGNGLGSLLTSFFKTSLPKALMIATSAIIVVSLITVFILLSISKSHLSGMEIALLLLLPSFFIGMPFPIILKMGIAYPDTKAVPILLGVSSMAGVAASIFAIVIAISFGYKMVFLLGLIGYGLLILLVIGYKMIFKKKRFLKHNKNI